MSAVSHAAEAPREALGFFGVAVLTLGALDIGLEGSIIVPALPAFADHYDASLIAVGWLATGFLLASVVAVPLFGRLGDMHGKRRFLLAALGAFAGGSLLCAIGDTIELAIVGRAIQGFGAAAGPLTLALARDTVAPGQLPHVIGAVIGASSVGGGIGFLLSGILVDGFSPTAIFWFLSVFGLALIVAIATFVRESPVRTNVPLDPAGILFLGAGLVTLLLAISKGQAWGWSSGAIVGLFVAAGLLLVLFAVAEGRVRQPHVDLKLVTRRPFLNANLTSFAFGFAFFTGVYVIPQIAAAPETSPYGLGLTTTQTGLLLVPACVAALVASAAAGRSIERVGPRALVAAGAVCGIAGNLALAVWNDTGAALAIGGSVVGLGWGFILPGVYTVVLRHASEDKSTVATAVVATFRTPAGAVGVTVSFAIVTAAGLSGQFRDESGFRNALLVAALGAAGTLVAGLTLPGRGARLVGRDDERAGSEPVAAPV